MKNYMKIVAVVLALVIALSAASCSLSKDYSYKTSDTELPIGVYIYALYSAYNQAQGFAQKLDTYDSEKGTYDGNKSFLNLEITDDDGNKATADEWIKDNADKTMKDILATEKLFKELGATVDEATLSGYEQSCKEYWDYGPYYAYYGEQYKNPYKDIFEPLGVSYDSFYKATYYNSALKEAVFDKLYGEGGTKAVPEEELTKYFTDNYTSYKYFSTNLYESQAQDTADENGDVSQGNVDVAFSEEKTAEYKSAFENYASSINAGESYKSVVERYMSAYSVENDPTVENVEIMKDSTIGEDLVAEIEKLTEGTASTKVIGEDNTAVLYLFYKEPIAEQVSVYIGDKEKKKSVLQSYKQEDFDDYIKEIGEGLEITISSSAKNFSLSKFEQENKTNTK